MKRLALVGALTAKYGDDAVRVLDAFGLEEIRTKALAAVLANLGAGGRVLIVSPARDERLDLSARNLPQVDVLLADSLNVVDVIRADVIVIEQPAIARLEEVYA
jgi:large subunit ribosomal protein L4